MATIEERVSRLEGGYDHLATKADVAQLRGELQGLKLTLVLAVSGAAVALGILQVALKYL